MNDHNPYQPPDLPSDPPPHPASIIVGGFPGLRGRYRIEWKFILWSVTLCIVLPLLPFAIEWLQAWWGK